MAAGSFFSGMASSLCNQPYALKKLCMSLLCFFLSERTPSLGNGVGVLVAGALGMIEVPLAARSLIDREVQEVINAARNTAVDNFILNKLSLVTMRNRLCSVDSIRFKVTSRDGCV